MCYDPKKSTHFSINTKVMSKYKIADTEIITNSIRRDLSIIVSLGMGRSPLYHKAVIF